MWHMLHAFDIQNYRQKCRFWKPSGARPPDQTPNNELFEGGLSDVLQGRRPRLRPIAHAFRSRPAARADADALRLSPSHHQSDKSLW